MIHAVALWGFLAILQFEASVPLRPNCSREFSSAGAEFTTSWRLLFVNVLLQTVTLFTASAGYVISVTYVCATLQICVATSCCHLHCNASTPKCCQLQMRFCHVSQQDVPLPKVAGEF